MGTASAWTPERRAKQAAIIARTRPWEKATGPQTAEGKAISSRNADKGVGEMAARFLSVRLEVRARFQRNAERLLDERGRIP